MPELSRRQDSEQAVGDSAEQTTDMQRLLHEGYRIEPLLRTVRGYARRHAYARSLDPDECESAAYLAVTRAMPSWQKAICDDFERYAMFCVKRAVLSVRRLRQPLPLAFVAYEMRRQLYTREEREVALNAVQAWVDASASPNTRLVWDSMRMGHIGPRRIAKMHGIPLGTVKSIQDRMRKAMRHARSRH